MKWKTLWEGRGILVPLAILWGVNLFLFPPLALLAGLALLFSVYFFRDPERPIPSNPLLILSPADGKIVGIEEIEETEFLHQRMRKISIFLSVFDVHVNRAPITGTITHSEPLDGIFLDARNPECSQKNQSRTWMFVGATQTVLVRQITGAIARRIVAWAQVGDSIQRGERFGMIRFGSRTEILIPLDAQVLVTLGERVRGAESPLAQFTS